jgi:hypothetical protein
MKTHRNCLGRALLATIAAPAIMTGSPQARAADSDRLVVSIGAYMKDETIPEPAKEGAEEDDIVLAGVPMLPSGTGYVRINDKDGKTLSDLLFYGALGNSLQLLSDPIPKDQIEIIESTTLLGTITEDGKLDSVGKYFGVLNAQIQVMSDLDTPESSTWVMMLLGFGGLGWAGYWSRARREAVAI